MKKTYRTMALMGALALGATANLSAEDLLERRESWLGIRELSVEMASVSIEARVGGSALLAERVDVPSEIEIAFERRGDSLRIYQKPRVFSVPLRNPGRISITLPQGTRLSLSSSSGGISLTGLDAARIALSASSGDISAKDCEGPFEAKTSSGSITLRDVEGERSLSSSSGSIQVAGGSGRIDASASSGDIELRDIEGAIGLETSSGGIRLSGVEGSLDLSSTSGGISGVGVRLVSGATLRTSSGGISLAFENPAAELSFDLKGSSGTLRVGSQRGERMLRVGGGRILVDGTSSSGDQTYTSR